MHKRWVLRIALSGLALVALVTLGAACGAGSSGAGGGSTAATSGAGGAHAKPDGGFGGAEKDPPTSGAGW